MARQRLPRAEREQQMLDVAHALFARRGYAGVTMDDVAEGVGVTKPLLYSYYGSKERLYLACLARSADGLIDTVVASIASTTDPADATAAGITAFFAFVAADKDAWAVLYDETLPQSGDIAERITRERERLTTLVQQALKSHNPRASAQTEIDALSVALLAAAEGLARWWLGNTHALSAAAAARLLIETVEPGLRARSRKGDR